MNVDDNVYLYLLSAEQGYTMLVISDLGYDRLSKNVTAK